MYTLNDVLGILARYGVETEEIQITGEIYRNINRQARQIYHEEEEQEEGAGDDEIY